MFRVIAASVHQVKMLRMEESLEKNLKDLYYNAENPEAYSSQEKVYRAAKKKFPKLTRKTVKKWFEKQPVVGLHKRVRYNFPRNKTIVISMGDQIQADLCDVRNLSKFNYKNNYILTGIDCFSRKGFAEPLKNKTGKELVRALGNIFHQQKFRRLQTDKGKEFLNVNVKNLLKSQNMELWVSENDDIKAALAERFNRTLKDKMYKYFTANNTRRWVDVIGKLVSGYNNSYHSSIKMPPNSVTKERQHSIRRILYPQVNNSRAKSFKFDINDLVRISKAKKVFRKGYLANWSTELFKITSRVARSRPVYTIEDLNGVTIKGKFYEEELVKVPEEPEDYLVERIIKEKQDNGKTKYLIKWVGYDSSFNSWVDESQIRQI